MTAALIATACTGVSIVTCTVWSLLKAPGRRHNEQAAANARQALAAMGAGCPDEVQPCARCEADAAAVDALNDDELTALARVLGVYVPSAGEIAADFDMWTEEINA